MLQVKLSYHIFDCVTGQDSINAAFLLTDRIAVYQF